MNKPDEAEAALQTRIGPDDKLEVDDRPRKVTLVQSVRMSQDLTMRVLNEAERRGITPSQLIRELVEAGLNTNDKAAAVNVADVHRVIDSLIRRKSV
jgi:predicted DNA-binding protein